MLVQRLPRAHCATQCWHPRVSMLRENVGVNCSVVLSAPPAEESDGPDERANAVLEGYREYNNRPLSGTLPYLVPRAS